MNWWKQPVLIRCALEDGRKRRLLCFRFYYNAMAKIGKRFNSIWVIEVYSKYDLMPKNTFRRSAMRRLSTFNEGLNFFRHWRFSKNKIIWNQDYWTSMSLKNKGMSPTNNKVTRNKQFLRTHRALPKFVRIRSHYKVVSNSKLHKLILLSKLQYCILQI